MRNKNHLVNLSKRCMVAIMSAAFLMSSVAAPIVFPVGVYANELADNPANNTVDEIASGDSMFTNNGTVTTNNGSISNNSGTVTTNNGFINENKGTVTTNSNNGIVLWNDSIVTTNNGTVQLNEGTVTTNNVIGSVSYNSGTITDNFGTVINYGTIENNYDGQVTNKNDGTVTNQYLSVTLTDMDGANATYNAEQFTAANNKQYLKVKNNGEAIENVQGTIELSAKQGYELSLADSFPVNETYGYELNMDEGKYYLTIYRPTASLTISPENIGLVISQLKKAGILPKNTDVEVTTSNVDVNDSAQETSVSRPAAVNPNMVEGYFAVNGQLLPGVVFGKTTQGVAAEAVFNANRPAGWNAAFSYNMAINGKVDYTLKNGVMSIIIPKEIQKAGRTFAIMALDKNGKAWTYSDTDTNPATITGAIYVEAYAFYLIYKD